ncbi:MAG: type II secretion system protein [Deltaproteobacteria bacterium]|nr:type II secretion system protein [Deltaproteobacteria bacterium]
MRKTIKPLKKHFKRLEFKNSELRTPNFELVFQQGFTLIEVIILIVMAGILLPVIIVPFATGIKGSQKPEMATKAMYLAHEEMEYRMKYNYGGPQLNPTNLTACQTSPPSGYQCQYEILYVPNNDLNALGSLGPDTNYKRMRVRVSDPQNDTYEIYSVVTRFP